MRAVFHSMAVDATEATMFDHLKPMAPVEPDTKRYVVMKRSPAGNRQWLNADGKFVLLRAHAARFSAEQAAALLVGGAVMEVAP